MAFDAGDIEGRLTLDRSPFQRELDKALTQGKKFAESKFTATLDADRSAFINGVNKARAAGVRFSQAKYATKLSADRHELTHALRKAAEDVRRFNRSNEGAGTSIGVNENDFRAAMKRIEGLSRSSGITVANNFRSPLRKIKWFAIFAGITAGAIAATPAILGLGGAVAALGGAFTGPVKALAQFNKAADAVAEGADNAAEQVAKFNGLMAKLTPEGRAFVAQAVGMRDEMKAFGQEMQRSVLPGFTGLLVGLEQAAPAITKGAGAVGAAVGDVASATGALLQNPIFQGQLEQAFENAVPVVRSLGMFVRNLFRDMTRFTAKTESLGIGIAGMVDNLSDGFTRFFENLIPYSDTLGQSFEGVGGIIEDLLGMLGTFSGIISSGFAPGLVIMRDALDGVYAVANGLLSGAMPGLTTAFSAFASSVGGVASVLLPLAPMLGSVVGALAPFALALKAVDLISFGRIGKSFDGLKGSIKATEGPLGKLKAGFKGIGSLAFGPLGIAVAGLGILLAELGAAQQRAAERAAEHRQRVQELTQAIIDDGGALGTTTRALVAKSLAETGAARTASKLGLTYDQITEASLGNDKAYARTVASLTKQAQAMRDTGKAVNGIDPVRLLILANNIEKNRAASKEAAKAALELKAAENGVSTATIAHWNALQQLNSALLASVDKTLAYRESQLQLKLAQQASAEAAKNSGKTSVEYRQALLGEERAILSVINAAGEKARANNATLPSEKQNKLAMEASAREALRLAQTYSGPLPKSLRDIIGGLDSSTAAALGMKDEVNKAGESVRKLPNGKTVRITANAGNFWDAVARIQSQPIVKAITFSLGPLPSIAMALAGMNRAKGAIDQYATGGLTYGGRRVRSMSSASAAMVPANTPRLIGDNTASRESFIPHDGSRRSVSLLRETNRLMGNPLNVQIPVGATMTGGGDPMAAIAAALERMSVTVQIGNESLDARVSVVVDRKLRPLVTATRAGAGKAR